MCYLVKYYILVIKFRMTYNFLNLLLMNPAFILSSFQNFHLSHKGNMQFSDDEYWPEVANYQSTAATGLALHSRRKSN